MSRLRPLLPALALCALAACEEGGTPAAEAPPPPVAAAPAPAAKPAVVEAPVVEGPAVEAPVAEAPVVAAAPASGPSPIPATANAAFCKDYEMFSRELALLRQRGEDRAGVEAMARTLPDGAAVNATVALAIIDRAWALPVAGSQAEKEASVAAFKSAAASDCARVARG